MNDKSGLGALLAKYFLSEEQGTLSDKPVLTPELAIMALEAPDEMGNLTRKARTEIAELIQSLRIRLEIAETDRDGLRSLNAHLAHLFEINHH